MAWIVCDKDGSLYIYKEKPKRNKKFGWWYLENGHRFPINSRSTLLFIGFELTWEHEPVEI